jgi:hypothetical protein
MSNLLFRLYLEGEEIAANGGNIKIARARFCM